MYYDVLISILCYIMCYGVLLYIIGSSIFFAHHEIEIRTYYRISLLLINLFMSHILFLLKLQSWTKILALTTNFTGK